MSYDDNGYASYCTPKLEAGLPPGPGRNPGPGGKGRKHLMVLRRY